ncbi:thioredoxin [Candidatus Cytomitobacter indipagum]|uniref:Thioredoxin n=1 Tax=Candidatus Cytomitobacter indipagum TaxID=2601575 RepID=A0A5C0UE45_9PROT|nr:thioredoxin [Candidatus Cytomitobacter indipagum]QEK37977.1 thioredoxin [Candidatus Cytomitobacter indipagum]
MNVININQENLNKLESGLCVLDFWAQWCGPCLNFSPIFEQVAKESNDGVSFCKINIDEMSSISQNYNVRSIPTLVILKDGKEIDRKTGSMSAEDLQKWINSNID